MANFILFLDVTYAYALAQLLFGWKCLNRNDVASCVLYAIHLLQLAIYIPLLRLEAACTIEGNFYVLFVGLLAMQLAAMLWPIRPGHSSKAAAICTAREWMERSILTRLLPLLWTVGCGLWC
jgi:hypothetical protein